LGYLLGGVIRGVLVTVLIFLVAAFFVPDFLPQHWLALLAITFLASGTFSLMGTLVGIWGKTFDGVAGFTTFIITPMAFLGGVFYSIHALPELARTLSHANPFFYYVDAMRWAFFGVSDIAPTISFSVALGFFLFFFACTYIAFATDWRMKT
jgi:Predicted membrane protein